MRCISSSRVTTRPCSSASACSSRNSVGVSSALSPSTYACTFAGSIVSSSISIRSPRSGDCGADAAADGGADAGDELAHRERLDQVVVGADLERADPVALGAAGADDDDRRPDPLAPHGLDQLPAVEAREHQVEHAGVRALVAQPREAHLAPLDGDGVESARLEMTRHPVRDHLVVLDDQHPRHRAYDRSPLDQSPVTIW